MSVELLVTRTIPEPGLDLLRSAGMHLTIHRPDRPMTRQELLSAVPGRQGVLCLLTDRIDAEILEAADRAYGFANYAVGYENIDVETASRLGILVSNTPGVLTETTADFAWSLLLAVARRVVEGDSLVREGRFNGWGPMLLLGTDVWGKTLGIIGAGRIGEAVARRAAGFGMNIQYCSNRSNTMMDALGVGRRTLHELLSTSDFITIHVSLNESTTGMIGAAELGLMKPEAIIINTSRGAVVDEDALVEALRDERIRGAGLDVFQREPFVHPELPHMKQVVLAPHIGSASRETREGMARMAATNLLAMVRGEVPANLVNAEALPNRRPPAS